MSEEIRIKVIQENQGDALKKAAEDADKLKHNGGKAQLATPPPNINAPQPPTKQQATQQQREAQQRNKALIADAEEDLLKAKASGAHASVIHDLGNQVREQKLKARFMREQNLPEEEATQKARGLVDLQNWNKAKQEAAKQDAAAQKAAAKDAAAEQKQQQAAGKQAAAAKQADEKKAAAQTAATKKKADAEATKELHEQNAVIKARESHLMRTTRAGARLAERVAGGSPLGGLAGAAATPQGMIAAAVAALVIGTAMSYGRRREGEALLGVEMGGERAVTARQLKRQAGFEGTAESNRAMAEGFKDESLAEQNRINHEEEKKKWRWLHPSTWIGSFTGEENIPEEEAKAKKTLSDQNTAKAEQQAREKYKALVEPLVEAQEKMNRGDAKGARALEDKVKWQQEYNRQRLALPTDDPDADAKAERGADAALATTFRERQQGFAHLLPSRGGAGDSLRLATASIEQRQASERAIADLHATVKQQGNRANDAMTRRNFSRGPGIPGIPGT